MAICIYVIRIISSAARLSYICLWRHRLKKEKKNWLFYYSDIRNYSYIEVTIQDIR